MYYFSLGSNLGDRLHNLRCAVNELSAFLTDFSHSIVLETEAILPNHNQTMHSEWKKPYLNMVVRGKSDLSPLELLAKVKEIERKLGRAEHYERWAPRVIDIDILLHNDDIVELPELTIPHQELINRPFLIHLLALHYPETKYQGKSTISLAHKIAAHNNFLNSFVLFPHFMGIINITPDSFSDGGNFLQLEAAQIQLEQSIKDGASIIDIGAQSTRPGATIISPKEELDRLIPILEIANSYHIQLSVDSYTPLVLEYLIKHYDLIWINDVQGIEDRSLLKKIADKGYKIATMHSLTLPPNAQTIVEGEVIDELYNWFIERIKFLCSIGFKHEDIILDPGIGFGKSIYQNLHILRNLSKFKELGCKLLLGHSRKSLISGFAVYPPSARDLETINLALNAYRTANVEHIRIHNVKAHQRAFVAEDISCAIK